MNGHEHASPREEELLEQLKQKDACIAELESEVTNLTEEVTTLKIEVCEQLHLLDALDTFADTVGFQGEGANR